MQAEGSARKDVIDGHRLRADVGHAGIVPQSREEREPRPVTPCHRPPFRLAPDLRSVLAAPPSPVAVLALQREVGNAAVAANLAAAPTRVPTVQTWTNPLLSLKDDPQLISDGLAGDIEAIKHISHYDSAIDAAKFGLIKVLVEYGSVWGRNATALEALWGAFGTRLPDVAGSNLDLWKRSVAADKELRNLAAVKSLPDRFIADVTATARGYLTDNEKTVNDEVASLGGNAEDQVAGPATADIRAKSADLLDGAQKLTHAREAMIGLDQIPVGSAITGEGGVDEARPLTFKEVFEQGGPPGAEANGGKLTYDVPGFGEIMAKYALAQAATNGLLKKYPALVGLEGGGGDAGAAATLATSDPEQARASVLAALHRVREHIGETREKLTGELPYELGPIHAQLFAGQRKGATDWTAPFPKSIAEATVESYKEHQFWVELGLTTLAAAAFVVAEIATGGMATFFAGFAVGIGVGQAAAKWEKAQALSNAAQASLDPDAQLVASGQAEAAGFDALLATVFAFIDIKMGAGVLSKVAGMAELAKIGELAIDRAVPLIEKAVAEHGVEATVKQTGKTPVELLEMVGKDSPAAPRLRTAVEAPRLPAALEAPAELGAAAQKAAQTRGMGLVWFLMTRQQRALELVEIVNERLAAGGLAPLKGHLWSGSKAAFFDFRTWKIQLSEAALKDFVHTDVDFARLIETAYHEARHCEQWFGMARYRAATLMPGETAGTIARELSIPLDVALDAVKKPVRFGTPEFNQTGAWYRAVYGAGHAGREAVLDTLRRTTTALDAAKAHTAALSRAPTAQLQAAQAAEAAAEAQAQAAYQAYRALPEEVDAWKVGEDAAHAYRALVQK